ncbi:MAG TPA: hypothetical protein V6D18_17290, partial [Thermosynechococcaceae cyanobacterium]
TPSPRPNTTNSGQPTDDGQRTSPTNGSVIQERSGTTGPSTSSSDQPSNTSTTSDQSTQGVRALW